MSRRVPLAAALVLTAALAGCGTERTVQRTDLRRTDAPIGDAERQLEADAERTGKDPRAWYRLARFYEAGGRLLEAERAYERYLASSPLDGFHGSVRFTSPHFCLGRIRLRLGKSDQAIAPLERVLQLEPTDATVWISNPDYREAAFLLGVIHDQKGDRAKADEHWRLYLRHGGARDRVLPWLDRIGTVD